MEDLFRMVLLRPAVAPDKKHPSIDLTQESKYQNDLRAAFSGGDPRKASRDESRAFVRLERFLGESAENLFADQLALLEELLVGLDHVAPVAVHKAVEKAFGRPAAETATDDKFLDTMSRLRDSIVAIKLLQEEHTRPLEELVGQLRMMELVVRADRDAAFPTDADELRIARFRTLQLPDGVGLGSALSTRTATEDLEAKVKVEKEKREAEIANLVNQHAEVEGVLVDLERLDPSHFAVTEQTKTDPVPGPDHLSPRALAEEQASFRSNMRDLLVRNSGEPVASDGEAEELLSISRLEPRGSSSIVEALLDVGAVQVGQGGFTPSAISFTLAPAAVKALSPSSRRALEARGLDLAEMPVDRAGRS
jgi:hypothetical protein